MQEMKLLDDRVAGTDHHRHCPDTWLPKYPFNSDSGLQQWIPGPDNESNGRLLTIFNTFEPNQTKQSSRNNSYLAAATTCYAYAVKRETGEWKKVDVATYIRYAFSPRQLYDRIMGNKGGQGEDVLRDISEQHSGRLTVTFQANKNNTTLELFYECLAKYGAGLVTKFYVDNKFRDSDSFSFMGSVDIVIDRSKTTRHAMVLVGVREDKSGQGWLLLQNSWEGKHFVEMTLEHLKSSKSELIFTADRHTKAREPFNNFTTDCLFTEADFGDGGDEEEDYYDY
jgi:hypothetical protein